MIQRAFLARIMALCFSPLLAVASGCASIERCNETSRTLFRLKHCVLQEVAGKPLHALWEE